MLEFYVILQILRFFNISLPRLFPFNTYSIGTAHVYQECSLALLLWYNSYALYLCTTLLSIFVSSAITAVLYHQQLLLLKSKYPSEHLHRPKYLLELIHQPNSGVFVIPSSLRYLNYKNASHSIFETTMEISEKAMPIITISETFGQYDEGKATTLSKSGTPGVLGGHELSAKCDAAYDLIQKKSIPICHCYQRVKVESFWGFSSS